MSARYVTLGCGRRIGLGAYVRAWRQCLALAPETRVAGTLSHSREPGTVADVLRQFREGLADRINRHIPGHGQGRKWDADYQRHMLQAAYALNTPRLAIHWLPNDLRTRFAHRLRRHDD